MVALAWNVLPAEMKYSVVELLNSKDTTTFSKSNREAYSLAVPTMFNDVRLNSYDALRSFMTNVPPTHCRHVRTLHVQVPPTIPPSASQLTTILSELLNRCFRVEELTLRIPSSLQPSIIRCFESLHVLSKLTIANIGHEGASPLSERLVVSIAASIPNLVHLTLDRITRSSLHAPELLGSYPTVPVVIGDNDVPAHRLLGPNLCLPFLLRIPTLRSLRVLDSHLGDRTWGEVTPACQLDVLELGSSCYVSPEFNRACADRILATVGRSLSELSLGSPLSRAPPPSSAPRRLRKLRLTPVFPLESLEETLSALSGCPIEQLAIECHEDDTEDMCEMLEDFLSLCVERRTEPFFGHLADVSLSTVSDTNNSPICTSTKIASSDSGAVVGIQRVQEYLRDIRSSQKTAGMHALPPQHQTQHQPSAIPRR